MHATQEHADQSLSIVTKASDPQQDGVFWTVHSANRECHPTAVSDTSIARKQRRVAAMQVNMGVAPQLEPHDRKSLHPTVSRSMRATCAGLPTQQRAFKLIA